MILFNRSCLNMAISLKFIRSHMTSRTGRNLSLCMFHGLPSLPEPKEPTLRPQIDYTDLTAIARQLYSAGVNDVSATSMIGKALSFNISEKILEVYTEDFISKKTIHEEYHIDRNIHVLAVGKAVVGMCRAVEDMFGDDIVKGVAVVPEKSLQALVNAGKEYMTLRKKFKFLAGGDGKTPCEQSLISAEYVSAIAKGLQEKDLLIILISGGGSALLTLPRIPLTLDDKMSLVQLMKSHGVPKLEENTVRKNLSRIKGGGLSEIASPAKVISLTLSNLPHSLSAEVSGGLTSPDSSTPQQALEILRKYNLVDKAPTAVIELLDRDIKEAKSQKWYADSLNVKDIFSELSRRHDTSNTINIVAGSEEIAVRGMLSQSVKYAIPAKSVIQSASDPSTAANGLLFACVAQYVASILTGNDGNHKDSELVGVELECIQMGMTKAELKEIAKVADDATSVKKPICLIFNSEIIADPNGSGIGGPCQEVALATAIRLKERSDLHECLRACEVQLFSIDTDGLDGGTNVAGAIANGWQATQIVSGKSAQEYLDNNDSFTFYSKLENGEYHVVTGSTDIDIQNFQLLLIRNRHWQN